MTTHEHRAGTVAPRGVRRGRSPWPLAMGIGRFAFTPHAAADDARGQLLDVAPGGWLAAANYAGYLAGRAHRRAHPAARRARLACWRCSRPPLLDRRHGLAASLALWLLLRFLAGVASAWVLVAHQRLVPGRAGALRAAPRAAAWLYAGVGVGIALAGLYCLASRLRPASRPRRCGCSSARWRCCVPVLACWHALTPRGASASRSAARMRPQRHRPAAARGAWSSATASSASATSCRPPSFRCWRARWSTTRPCSALAWPVFGATAALSTLLAAWLLRGADAAAMSGPAAMLLMALGCLLPVLRLSASTDRRCPRCWWAAPSWWSPWPACRRCEGAHRGRRRRALRRPHDRRLRHRPDGRAGAVVRAELLRAGLRRALALALAAGAVGAVRQRGLAVARWPRHLPLPKGDSHG